MSTKPIGFWGLVVEPGKMYSQEVPVSFKMTMATLGPEAYVHEGPKPSGRTILMLTHQKDGEFALCSLVAEKHDQQALDVVFMEGETIHLRVIGENAVHLTGYYIEDAEDDPMAGYDDEEIDAELNGEDIDTSDDSHEEDNEDDEDEEEDNEDEEIDSDMAEFIDDGSEVDEDEDEDEKDDGEDTDNSVYKVLDKTSRKEKRSSRIREIASEDDDNKECGSECEAECGSKCDSSYDSEEEDSGEESYETGDSEGFDSEMDEDSEGEENEDDEDDDEDDDEEEESEEEEEEEEEDMGRKKPLPKKSQPESKKIKLEDKPVVSSPAKRAESAGEKSSKPATPTGKENSSAASTPNKTTPNGQVPVAVDKTLPSGLKIQDLAVGQGIKAQKGRRCTIKYTITNEAGKTVASNEGKEGGYSFVLGEQGVQKAIGMGIQGMALGGERQLVIPASMIEEKAQPALTKSGNCIVKIKLESVQSLAKNAAVHSN